MKLKTTLQLSLSLFATSVVLDLMLIFLTVSLGFFNSIILDFVNLFLSLFIYVYFIYTKVWKEGYRDPNRVHCGHMEKFMAKGLVAGLIADLPYAILTVLTVFSRVFHLDSGLMNIIFLYSNVAFFSMVGLINRCKMLFLYFLLLIPLPLIAEIAYILGYKRIAASSNFMFKKKKNDTMKAGR